MIADVTNDLQLVSYRAGQGLWLLSDSRAQDTQGRLIGPDYINKGADYLRPEISSSLMLMDIHLLSYPTYVRT